MPYIADKRPRNAPRQGAAQNLRDEILALKPDQRRRLMEALEAPECGCRPRLNHETYCPNHRFNKAPGSPDVPCECLVSWAHCEHCREIDHDLTVDEWFLALNLTYPSDFPDEPDPLHPLEWCDYAEPPKPAPEVMDSPDGALLVMTARAGREEAIRHKADVYPAGECVGYALKDGKEVLAVRSTEVLPVAGPERLPSAAEMIARVKAIPWPEHDPLWRAEKARLEKEKGGAA